MKKLLLACVAVMIGLSSYVFVVGRAEIAAARATNERLVRLAEAVERLTSRMDQILKERAMSNPGEQYDEWWSGSPPTLQSVTTARRTGESVEDWTARHDAAVAAAKAENPPV